MVAGPIRDDEIPSIFAYLMGAPAVALAVSGGADSVALTHLAARWREVASGVLPEIVVVTVDHGLRPEAAAEARWVGELARSHGFRHATLPWEASKPQSGIEALARAARYDLIASFCHEHAIPYLATAHHLDDQAETVLMRLARGSGVDGLAAIPRLSHWAGISIARPLLDQPKSRLLATLEAAGQDWLEDPSNETDQFERNRIRRAMTQLEQLGFSAERLALTARRMRRAQDALEAATDEFLKTAVTLYDTGHCVVGLGQFSNATSEIALRGLRRALAAIGGGTEPVRLRKLEKLIDVLDRPEKVVARTLAGCRIAVSGGHIRITREKGRIGFPELTLAPGESRIWDRRFKVSVSSRAAAALTVRALGGDNFARLRRDHLQTGTWPSEIGSGLVSFWRGRDLVSVPHLGYSSETDRHHDGTYPQGGGHCGAQFVNAALLAQEDTVTARG